MFSVEKGFGDVQDLKQRSDDVSSVFQNSVLEPFGKLN